MVAAGDGPTDEHASRTALVLRYGLAVLTSGLAGVLTGWVSPFMGSASFFEFFHMAVVVSAFAGGLGPGLVAASISFLVLDYYFITPQHLGRGVHRGGARPRLGPVR